MAKIYATLERRRALGISSLAILGMVFLLAPLTLQAQSTNTGQSDPSTVDDTQAAPTENPPSTGATTPSTNAQQQPLTPSAKPRKEIGGARPHKKSPMRPTILLLPLRSSSFATSFCRMRMHRAFSLA